MFENLLFDCLAYQQQLLLLKLIPDSHHSSQQEESQSLSNNEKGHLFSGIHQAEIAAAIKEKTRLDIPTSHIELIKPIKEIGEHSVTVKVGEKRAAFIVVVKATG